ncbi:hypothetical protein AG1IA_04830 [Rhizoctonia solani AG-1 IA]|uniref:Uncharacterized protein n=1 Tax=Thanatephorus cucumeris (strain AG1-IA) TaxID=983506 RepID=L8WT33_THACA|nr:hypothetical protein AG1IA_04830 [Rhizoctonia solani AG-1 IA]
MSGLPSSHAAPALFIYGGVLKNATRDHKAAQLEAFHGYFLSPNSGPKS